RRISTTCSCAPCDQNVSSTENLACLPSSNDLQKSIPVNIDDYKALKKLKPFQPQNPHLLKVSILGEPNAGKSTLTNSLVKWKVCAVSSKVHTTRKKAAAVLVEENKQIVFLDTPGFVTPEQIKKHSLESSFVMDPRLSVRDANIIAVVVDIANKYTNNRINENILELLQDFKEKQTILILNKIDAMKSKTRLLSFTKTLTCGCIGGVPTSEFEKTSEEKGTAIDDVPSDVGKKSVETDFNNNQNSFISQKRQKDGWPHFSRVFMVSSLKNDGIEDLRNYLFSQAIPHDWMYPDSLVTDQHPHDIALMIVREKLLEYLPQEIPYQVQMTISKWELLPSGCPKIDIKIHCTTPRHKRFIIGPNGKHIAACADKSRKAMREAFRKDVVLHLGVK
ncbi:GTPase Era, mitochondrial, partial [Parasteatoda tepidariorum]|uniref:GTPase Era, mitochondrial n=1 Tax=Parasteatoda tepidariorum TaxID=114398 RepID=UPI001C723F85